MSQSVPADARPDAAAAAAPLLLCSTGAISRFTDINDHRRFARMGAGLESDGLEVMIFSPWYGRLDEIAADFDPFAIRIPATHAEKNLGPHLASDDPAIVAATLEHYSENCRFTHLLGGDRTVLHLWGLPESDRVLDRMLVMLPELVDRAAEHDVQLAVESIPCLVDDPLTNIKRVLEADPRSRVALDTEFLSMHDQLDAVLDADWLWADNAVVHVHVKDFLDPRNVDPTKRRYLHPGEGQIDFPSWFTRLAARGYDQTISLESPANREDGTIDTDKINASLRYLRSLIEGVWS
ncbi:MAG: TIM barrel protein [Thermomicrobiales bacterium]